MRQASAVFLYSHANCTEGVDCRSRFARNGAHRLLPEPEGFESFSLGRARLVELRGGRLRTPSRTCTHARNWRLAMRRVIAGVTVVAALALAAPAFAIHDNFILADECAPPNAEAVGHPAGSPNRGVSNATLAEHYSGKPNCPPLR